MSPSIITSSNHDNHDEYTTCTTHSNDNDGDHDGDHDPYRIVDNLKQVMMMNQRKGAVGNNNINIYHRNQSAKYARGNQEQEEEMEQDEEEQQDDELLNTSSSTGTSSTSPFMGNHEEEDMQSWSSEMTTKTGITGKSIIEEVKKKSTMTDNNEMSTVGSFSPTLADNVNMIVMEEEKDDDDDDDDDDTINENKEVALIQETNIDDNDISTIGSYAPTLAELVSLTPSAAKQLLDTWNDGIMSSVGSNAPTLATLQNQHQHQRQREDEGENEEVSSYCNTSIRGLGNNNTTGNNSIVSSSSTTTTIVHGSEENTISNKVIQVSKDVNLENDAAREAEDGMSSIGMSKAPTLANQSSPSSDENTDSNDFTNRSVRIHTSNDQKDVDLSTIGSYAPTLNDGLQIQRKSILKAAATTTSLLQKRNRIINNDDDNDDQNIIIHDNNVSSSDNMVLLGTVLGRETTITTKSALENIVGTFLCHSAIVGFILWIILLGLIVLFAPTSSYQYMNPKEQIANTTLLTLLLGVNINRLGPILLFHKRSNNNNNNQNENNFLTSGAIIAVIVVQFIAITSVTIMTVLPTPILIDPIMGIRCHLVRWAEWTALAFIMCALSESIDLSLDDDDGMTNNNNKPKHCWIVGICISASTACGGIFPFCTTELSWWIVFTISCLLYMVLYVRLIWRGYRLSRMSLPNTTTEEEAYERTKYSFKLLLTCSIVWTILVVAWTGCALAPRYIGPNSFWSNDWMVLAVENICEGLSKICYLSILIEVHELLFDEESKTARRLNELRACMSTVWDEVSDVVIICSSHDHMVNAAVSPSFFQIESSFGLYARGNNDTSTTSTFKKTDAQNDRDYQKTLALEVDPYDGSYKTYEIDLSKPMSRNDANSMMMMINNRKSKTRIVTPVFERNVKILSDLVCDACTLAFPKNEKQYKIRRDFYCINKERKEEIISCEAKVVKLKDKMSMIVLRNVTNHHHRRRRRRGSNSLVEVDDKTSSSSNGTNTKRLNKKEENSNTAMNNASKSNNVTRNIKSERTTFTVTSSSSSSEINAYKGKDYDKDDDDDNVKYDCMACAIM